MRKIKILSAVLCVFICMTALCACGKQKSAPADTGVVAAAPSENGIADEEGETYAGDRLARVVNVENGICGFEYYDGQDIGDYAKIDINTYTATGDTDGVDLNQVKLYNAAGGQWSDAAVEDFSPGMYIVITRDVDSGEVIWVSIVG